MKSILILLLIIINTHTIAQEPAPFNMGRTRAFAGFWFYNEGKSLFHTITFKKDSASMVHVKIAESHWRKGGWSSPQILHLTPGSESIPILYDSTLYFTSSTSVENSTTTDLNIWHLEIGTNSRQSASTLSGLNTSKNDRLCFIDSNGRFYVSSDRSGNYDIYLAEYVDNQWKITPFENWNSSADENYVSINDELGIALLQRTEPGKKSELLISYNEGNQWTQPEPLVYPYKNTHPYYSQRTPMISSDRSTFYFTQNGLLWQQSLENILDFNSHRIKHSSTYKPLRVKPRIIGEPTLFGNVTLKTNNGISFNRQMDRIYISQYTSDKDSTGNFHLKLFESTLRNGNWQVPQLVTFNNSSAPFEYHPTVSPFDNSIYFNSRAPLTTATPYESKNNIWQWQSSSPTQGAKVITQTTTPFYDDYACQAKSGNLYFRSDRPGGKGRGDIYVCHYENGTFNEPVPIGELNSQYNENDLCIDPDERFVIFNRYIPSSQEMQLFLSIKSSTGWTTPRVIGQLENKEDWELTPTISPDRKYFFYEVNSNIIRVELETLFTSYELRNVQLN